MTEANKSCGSLPTFKNERDVDGIDQLFAPDFWGVEQPSPPGLVGFKGVGGDSMMNEARTNLQVRWTEIHIYPIRNGKIRDHWVQ